MRFVAVPIAFLRAAPAVSASNSALGAWLKIYGYAAEIEAGGVIPSCSEYDDRRWLSAAAVMRSEVNEAATAALVEWRGPDLFVFGYDLEAEAKVRACRENGKKSAGRPRRAPETQAKPEGKPSDNPPVSSSSTKAQPPISSPPVSSPPVSSPPVSTNLVLGIGGSSEPAADGPDSKPPTAFVSPVLMTFPCAGKVPSWDLTEAQVSRWRELYPALDVLAEARKALAWVESNHIKTAGGMPKYLVGWLNKATNDSQGRGGNRVNGVGQAKVPTQAFPEGPQRL